MPMPMQPTPAEPPVLRDRVHVELRRSAEPITAAQIAARLLPDGPESARRQTMRALAELEAAGHATRHLATGGRYTWTIH